MDFILACDSLRKVAKLGWMTGRRRPGLACGCFLWASSPEGDPDGVGAWLTGKGRSS